MNQEFRHAHEVQIEEWQLYWSPNFVSITMGIVAPSGVMAIPNISLANGSGNAISSEPLEVVELLGVVVQGHALVHGVHYLYLIQLWNSFVSCNGITKGLGLRSCRICKISNINPMRVCENPMHGCVC
jgi:hypothetical protein